MITAMHDVLKTDLYRYKGLKGFTGHLKGLLIPGYRYTFLYRKASKGKKYSIRRLFFEYLKRVYSVKYGFQISWRAQIGKGLYLGHFGTIVINSQATIGEYCNIAQGVTIGQTNRGEFKGAPTIGNFVWMGAGAVIVGKIVIGSNVLIAPNAFVNVNVPSNSIVIGNPAKVIHNLHATQDYINYVLDKNILGTSESLFQDTPPVSPVLHENKYIY